MAVGEEEVNYVPKSGGILASEGVEGKGESGITGALGEFADTALIVTPGKLIASDSTPYLRGHGTFVNDRGQLIASVCGIVEQVNKLVTVVPLRSRYVARVGEVVVGRITELQAKRWKVDINSLQDGHLSLNSVNLPSGELRRRKEIDALNMRQLLEEDDLVSAEVQDLRTDVSLHTRSVRYGKLANGKLIIVQPCLVKRIKQHFVYLDVGQGVELILGCNGYIWVATPSLGKVPENRASFSSNVVVNTAVSAEAVTSDESEDVLMKDVPVQDNNNDDNAEAVATDKVIEAEKEDDEPALQGFAARVNNPNNAAIATAYSTPFIPTPHDHRLTIARVANSIIVLNLAFIAIYPTTILDVYSSSLELNLSVPDMLQPDRRAQLVAQAMRRKGRGK